MTRLRWFGPTQAYEGENYIGEFGETVVHEYKNAVMVHDGLQRGGKHALGFLQPQSVPFNPLNYVFALQTQFTISHNLGRIPLVQVVDQATKEIIGGQVLHVDNNTIEICFAQPTSGVVVVH